MISKHQRRDADGKWIPGKLRVFENSSLRKLMRATRRGMMPPERQVLIDAAVKRAGERQNAYLNSSPLKSAYVAKREAAKRARRAAQ